MMNYIDLFDITNKWLDHLGGTPLFKRENWPQRAKEAERRITSQLNNAIDGINESIVRQLRRRGLAQVIGQSMTDNILLDAGLSEAFNRLTDLLVEERPELAEAGRNSVISQLQQEGISADFIDFEPHVSERIRDEVGPIVDTIKQNLIEDFEEVIVDGYEEGKGIDEIAADIDNIEDQVKDYKTERIARTEVNGAQNEGKEQTYDDFNVDYEQWLTVDPGDEDVRGHDPHDEFDHVMMHGQVVRTDDNFVHPEQGWTLPYPGAKEGDPGNIINCRCTTRPYIPEPGEEEAIRQAITQQGYYYPGEEVELEIEEAETIEEAEEWVEDNYDFSANYRNQDIDLVNEHNRAIQKTLDEFPEAEEAIGRIRSMKAKGYAGKYAPKIEKDEPLEGHDLRISYTHFGDKDSFENLKETQTEGYAVSFEDFNEQSVVAHEIGHALEFKLAAKKNGINFGDTMTKDKRRKLIETWNHHTVAENIKHDALKNMGLPKYGKETAEEIRKLGSMSAGSDSELVAQAVANYISTDNPTQLATEIVKELKERL